MKTELVIRDVRRTESLETYLTTQMEGVVESILPKAQAVMRLKVEEDSHRTQTRRPHFECSVYLKVGKGKPIRIKKQDAEFHTCVDKLASSLREALRRSHQKANPVHRSNRFEEPVFSSSVEFSDDDNSLSA